MDTIRIDERFSVGTGQPSRDELRQLAREGFETVVNLRSTQETDHALDPAEEGDEVRSQGLDYVHIPVSSDRLTAERVDRFRAELSRHPTPIFIHCASGIRSGAFTMLHVAAEQRLPGAEALERARTMGIACDSESIERFVKAYADEHA